jgi:hypothetical protein
LEQRELRHAGRAKAKGRFSEGLIPRDKGESSESPALVSYRYWLRSWVSPFPVGEGHQREKKGGCKRPACSWGS